MIHYHGTPIGGRQIDATNFLVGRHALISFANPQNIATAADVCQSFCLDNGAFTMWRGGKTPDWDIYIEWVKTWCRHPGFDWWLIPDVIGGAEKENWNLIQKYKDAAPFAVPVYHMHEDLRYLELLVRQFPRVALGSSGAWRTPGTSDWWARMSEIMSVVCSKDGRPRVKLHGLRMLNTTVFSKLPLSSADSCNAGRNNHESKRFGMYMPPTSAQRAEVIAARIEAVNSAPQWVFAEDV